MPIQAGLFIEGYATKEVAEMKGVTPSAISQQYHNIRERVIVPYLRQHFDMELDMPEIMMAEEGIHVEKELRSCSCHISREYLPKSHISNMDYIMEKRMFNAEKARKAKRTTPDYITELAPNEVFVFGSNLRGMHGGGAALIAYKKFGAVMGQGVGLQGKSYGIPTMQGGVETIKPYVDEFIEFAKTRPDLTFLVTRIGCGIAGFQEREISPLFKSAHDVENIILPKGW